MFLRRFLTLFLALCSLNSTAQRGREDCFGSWTIIAGKHQISERWSIPTVGILRHYEIFKNYEFAFVGTGLTYRFNPNLSGTVGYVFLDSEPFIVSPEAKGARQHWLYEQFTLNSELGRLGLSHRYRLESRWILQPEGTVLRHRMRYQLQLRYPFAKKMYANVFNEVFVSFQEPLFNQNRLHLGLGYQLRPHLKFELGYLKVHFNDLHCDSIRVALIFKADWRKN